MLESFPASSCPQINPEVSRFSGPRLASNRLVFLPHTLAGLAQGRTKCCRFPTPLVAREPGESGGSRLRTAQLSLPGHASAAAAPVRGLQRQGA